MSRMHNPAHPGEVLREYLPENLAVTEAARRLGVTRQALLALLNGRAGVSAEMALRLVLARLQKRVILMVGREFDVAAGECTDRTRGSRGTW